MRLLLLSLFLLPLCATAQTSQSAIELSHEIVEDYVSSKIFRKKIYQPVAFGTLQPASDKNNYKIAWRIEHKFEIAENNSSNAARKAYKFIFFFGKRMNIIRADAAYVE